MADLAKRCKDCVAEGLDPKGTRKLATKPDGSLRPGPRCVTHWRARKRQVSSAAHSRHLEKNFRITETLYWALYAAQGGRCFICRIATGKSKRLCVEHEHGLCDDHPPEQGCPRCIRCLSCSRCNRLIAFLGVEALCRAIQVLTDPPARKILAGEPTAIPPTMPGVTVDDKLPSGWIDAFDRESGIDLA